MRRFAWWLLALLAIPFVVWMSDETCDRLLRKATLTVDDDDLD